MNHFPCLGTAREAAPKPLRHLVCDVDSNWSMPQVSCLNRATGLPLGAITTAYLFLSSSIAGLYSSFQVFSSCQMELGTILHNRWGCELTPLPWCSRWQLHAWYWLCFEGDRLRLPSSQLKHCWVMHLPGLLCSPSCQMGLRVKFCSRWGLDLALLPGKDWRAHFRQLSNFSKYSFWSREARSHAYSTVGLAMTQQFCLGRGRPGCKPGKTPHLKTWRRQSWNPLSSLVSLCPWFGSADEQIHWLGLPLSSAGRNFVCQDLNAFCWKTPPSSWVQQTPLQSL